MNGSVTQHHTPRTNQRGGSTHQRMFGGTLNGMHNHHPSHGNLSSGGSAVNYNGGTISNKGPALPLNPIPKEPPRNFLSNAAVNVTETVDGKQPITNNCCQQSHHQLNGHANSCGALLELSTSGVSSCQTCEHNNTQQRCIIAGNFLL